MSDNTIKLHDSFEGFYEIQIVKEDGTLKEGSGLNVPFKNLITNAGLDRVGDANLQHTLGYGVCKVGTGATIPSVFDTALSAQTGSASGSGSAKTPVINSTTLPYSTTLEYTYTFNVGAVSGNLSEVGIFTPSSVMWSRSLIKDSNGNPTTISILPTEQLKVVYTLVRYLPSEKTGTVSISVNGTPTSFDYVLRPANLQTSTTTYWNSDVGRGTTALYTSETQTLGGITEAPSGTSKWNVGTSPGYVAGTYSINEVYTLGISDAVYTTGIGSMCYGGEYATYADAYCGFQISFTPKIPKTATQSLTLTFQRTWGRA